MESSHGPSRSLWSDTAETLERPAIKGDLTVDICVIGAGITGASVAYLLAREGREVLLIDDGAIGGGETCHTTAHLTTIHDERYFDLEHLHGAEGARIAADSHRSAIETIESIVGLESIECDFERVDGYLFAPPGDPIDDLERELEAAHAAGLSDVEMVERAPIRDFHTGRSLRFPNQAMFHPIAYLNAVVRAFERLGGRVHGGTHVMELEDDGEVRIQTRDKHTIRASSAVVATNSPIHLTTRIHTKQVPYRSYVIGALVPRGDLTAALYYDTSWPYHYVRLQRLTRRGKRPMDVLIVGGEDHKTGAEDDASERYARLEAWARERFPTMEGIVWTWSGQVLQPVDGVAYIGRDNKSKNVYFSTGDAGMGMTHGTIAGRLITDLIQGRENPWARLYDPDRQSLRRVGRYLRDNLGVAKDFAERLTGGDVSSEDEIRRDSGAVIRRGLHKVAVYRDEKGRLHERSAVCPHLGCVVAWNSEERSWDCPCHGSRFDPQGHVLNGPATGDLPPAEKHRDERAA